MKRVIGLTVLALALACGVASAQSFKGGLGFHDVEAPIGLRWWFNPKVALDAGLGFGSDEIGGESYSHFALDLGVPIVLNHWDRVNFMVRPGIAYRSQEVDLVPGPGTGDDTTFGVLVELEGELFLADNFSVSAAHGFGIVNADPANGASTTDWGTFGSNFTNVGFHVYLFGGTR